MENVKCGKRRHWFCKRRTSNNCGRFPLLRGNNNYNLALSRLHQLFKMSQKNPQCWKQYCSIIIDQQQKGFIGDAPLEVYRENPCYYIPHEAVMKESSDSVRFVSVKMLTYRQHKKPYVSCASVGYSLEWTYQHVRWVFQFSTENPSIIPSPRIYTISWSVTSTLTTSLWQIFQLNLFWEI